MLKQVQHDIGGGFFFISAHFTAIIFSMRIVSGKYRGKKVTAPMHGCTRPTSDRTREMIFNVLLHNPAFGPHILNGKSVLDVFAGTGALGLEAHSRGAKSVTFIENHKDVLPILYGNVKGFDLSSSCVLVQDARCLQKAPSSAPFDLVFLDPPYHQNLVLPTLTQLVTQESWLAEEAVIVIEMGKSESLVLPSFLSLVTERTSGAAKVLFCCLK